VTPTGDGLDLLGYRVFPYHRRLRNDNGHRFARKMRRYAKGFARGPLDWGDIDPSVQSWIGHACHADTLGLRRRVFSKVVSVRKHPYAWNRCACSTLRNIVTH